MVSPDVDILVIGAGMSGLGLAAQLHQKYPGTSYEIIEKENNVGGTWLVNTYPGCGCDVASHFYSYSFHLNPDWSQKFSLRGEIQTYFRQVAEDYNITPNIRFQSTVETARWSTQDQLWTIVVKDHTTKQTYIRHARILVSAVGSLSVPRKCEIPGAESFKGTLFHSAQWDKSFDAHGKEVVVIGNGCSATQFVPLMSRDARSLTQFARQPHYLAERPNPTYSTSFKALMRYMPFAMRVYRFWLYAQMEKDFAGFYIESGKDIRQDLKRENERYVKRMAPERYWDALIPKHEIGCKRKVMDTDYLACLHRDNVELIHDDTIASITETGVHTKTGRNVHADSIVLATGFEVNRMLAPIEIQGEDGKSLNDHWRTDHGGAPQAYFGTCVPGFPNFFIFMGPNTVTGHLSVIYTVECQINFMLRLVEPILASSQSPASSAITAVSVKHEVAAEDSEWMQNKLKKLVWASGCTSWALDPETGSNIAMYPQYQFLFWLRSVFIPAEDFKYTNGFTKTRKTPAIGGWKAVRRWTLLLTATAVLTGGFATLQGRDGLHSLAQRFSAVVKGLGTSLKQK